MLTATTRRVMRAATLGALIAALTLLASLPAQAARPILPAPDLTPCTPWPVTPAPQPGTTPATPGRWWNSNRPGTGWDLNFSQNNQNLYLVWYTHDAGVPVWLLSDNNPVSGDTWGSVLYKYTFNTTTNTVNFPPQEVGSVAIRFMPNQPDRAVIQWQWDRVGVSAPTAQCISDYLRRDTSNRAPAAGTINASYTGAWYEYGFAGQGIFTTVGQPLNTESYVELHGLAIYDTAGQPVWLDAQSAQEPNPPTSGDRTIPAYYVRLGSGYPTGFPTNDCPLSSNTCYTPSNVGTFMRRYDTPGTGWANINITAASASIGGGTSINWTRPTGGYGTVDIRKLTDADIITANRLSCTVPEGQSTCAITVNWGSTNGMARAHRVDLVSGARSLVGTNFQGEYTDPLPGGSRIQYELRAGTAANSTLLSRTPEVRAVTFSVPDQTVESLSSELPANDPTAGAIDMDASTEGGAAVVRIPIPVPPGRRGMQPDLAWTYSSRSGPGIAGLGTSISGLSSIHRCPATPEQDGYVASVLYATSDKLCLDGTRLIPVAATTTSPVECDNLAITGEYRTEVDSFTRVLQCAGDINNAQTFFKAQLKSGEVQYFGGTSTTPNVARVTPSGAAAPLSWQIVRRADRTGNTVNYEYQQYGAGESLIKNIYYTTCTAADANCRRVEFSYIARSGNAIRQDFNTSYLSGGLTQQTQILSMISTWVGTERVRDFELAMYPGIATRRSQPISVKDCGYENGVRSCRRAATFSFNSTFTTFDTAPFSVSSLPAPQGSSSSALPNTFGVAQDFDGDGIAEVNVGVRNASNAYDQYLVSLRADRTVLGYLPMPAGAYYDAVSIAGNASHADFNNDGRADLPVSSGGLLRITTWEGTPGQFHLGQFASQSTSIPVGANEWIDAVADFDGDGRSDVLVNRAASGTCAGSVRQGEVYLNTTTQEPSTSQAPGTITFGTTPTRFCLPGRGNFNVADSLDRVTDFDGNGLPDLIFTSSAVDSQGMPLARDNDLVLFSQRNVGGGFSFTQKSFAQLFASSTAEQRQRNLFTFWMDLNADGLDDMLYAGVSLGAASGCPVGGWSGAKACWTIALNNGGTLLPAQQTTSDAGIEIRACASSQACNTASQLAFRPRHGNLIRVADTNADGRDELLIPSMGTPFALQVCQRHTGLLDPAYPVSGVCPTQKEGQWDGSVPCTHAPFYFCPENPRTGASVLGTAGPGQDISLRFNGTPAGTLDTVSPAAPFANLYQAALDFQPFASEVAFNPSIYKLNALRFFHTVDGKFGTAEVDVGELAAPSNVVPTRSRALDVYSDGVADVSFFNGCWKLPANGGCGVPYQTAGGANLNAPQTLFGDTAPLKQGTFLSENLGAGRRGGSTTLPPLLPDSIQSAGVENGWYANWDFFPLSSGAGRTAGETAFYSIPANRYVDARHFYFSASMPAVSEMYRSDGIGGTTATEYSYREAMFNHQGRGFQGFRTIIEDDFTQGQKSTYTFHQKFPLAGNLQSLEVKALATGNLIRTEDYTWRCNRTNRADTNCAFSAPTATTVRAPFLDMKETKTYDPLIASAQTTRVREIAVNQESDTASSIDAYGNAANQLVISEESSGVLPGFEVRVAQHTRRTTRNFSTDAAAWWVDKLNSESIFTSIAYGSSHSVPAGVAASPHTLDKQFQYNADRTLFWEGVEVGTLQQEAMSYGYPSPSYGLPSALTKTGASSGSRSTSIQYSADGYFPQTVVNPLFQSETVQTRAKDGQPSLKTDANLRRTKFTYDQFGLLVRTEFRGTSDAVQRAPDAYTSRSWCINVSICPGRIANVYFRTTRVQDGAPTVDTYLDIFDRPLKVETRLLDGTKQVVETRYNARGLVTQQSEPARSGATQYWTTYSGFDVLGRPTQRQQPRSEAADGGGDLITTYTYQGRRTQIVVKAQYETQPLCASSVKCLDMTRTTDVLGRIIETKDAMGGFTQFWFDGPGNTVGIRDANASIIAASYDDRGRRTNVADPNMGSWTFTYNGFGEVTAQSDARGIVTNYTYDSLGRRKTRTANADADGTGGAVAVSDLWEYDPQFALGELYRESRTVGSSVRKRDTYGFDSQSLGRRITATTEIQNSSGVLENYVVRADYDSYYGRIKQWVYPDLERVQLVYSKYGHLTQERDPVGNVTYRQVTAVDGRGQTTTEAIGGSITATYNTLATTGQVDRMTYTRAGMAMRTLSYNYDVLGNLMTRSVDPLGPGAMSEGFYYDKLLRLTQSSRGISGQVLYDYDAVGNIRKKTDFSVDASNAYSYASASCGGGPNAVKSVSLAAGQGGGTRSYCYDANGNLTSDSTGMVTRYDLDNVPTRIDRGGQWDVLRYDQNGQRFRQQSSDGFERLYVGNGFEREYTPTTGWASRIYVGKSTIVVRFPNGTRRVDYMLNDRLGSVDTVTDQFGLVKEKRGYDAFGKPRNGDWTDRVPPKLGSASVTNTPKGFTQHEHLDAVKLIHMNGRVYDYELGRFMSVDPIIGGRENSQALNPYGYVMNNPLSGADPSGYTCKAMVGTHACGIDTGAAGGFTSQTITTRDGNGKTVTVRETYSSGGARGGTTTIQVSGHALTNGSTAQGSSSAAAATADPRVMGGGAKSCISPNSWRQNSTEGMSHDYSGSAVPEPVTMAEVGDAVLGFLPISGEATSIYELFAGRSLLSQQPASRIWAAVGVLTFGYGKYGKDVERVYEGMQVTARGLARIESHLTRFPFDPANAAMVERLRTGNLTTFDVNFYAHELKESALMARGLEYDAAHAGALGWQGIPHIAGYEARLYHPEVIGAFPETFTPAARAAAGVTWELK